MIGAAAPTLSTRPLPSADNARGDAELAAGGVAAVGGGAVVAVLAPVVSEVLCDGDFALDEAGALSAKPETSAEGSSSLWQLALATLRLAPRVLPEKG